MGIEPFGLHLKSNGGRRSRNWGLEYSTAFNRHRTDRTATRKPTNVPGPWDVSRFANDEECRHRTVEDWRAEKNRNVVVSEILAE
jgi:hypothetical protein